MIECAFGVVRDIRNLNRRTACLERIALLVSVRKRTRTAGGIPSCPGLIPATSIDVAPHCGDHLFRLTSEPMRFPPIDVAPHCGDHLFRLTSEPMRFPPLEVIGSSPRSSLKTSTQARFPGVSNPAHRARQDSRSLLPSVNATLWHRFLHSPRLCSG